MFRPSFLIPALKAHDSASTAGMGGRSAPPALAGTGAACAGLRWLALAHCGRRSSQPGRHRYRQRRCRQPTTAAYHHLQPGTNRDRAGDTPATIEFLQYPPGEPGSKPCRCRRPAIVAGTQPVPIPPPDFDLAHRCRQPGVLYHAGEYLYLRLTDLDENRDPSRVETVIVTVICIETGDPEILVLTETGPDTGVFAGYLPTIASGPLSPTATCWSPRKAT